MIKGRLLPWREASAAENMAVDEAIYLQYLQGCSPITLRYYGWRPAAVSIGYSQDPKKEIDLAACAQRRISWVRRPTGGRSVFHDHEITYSLVAGEAQGFTGPLLQDYLKVAEGFKAGFSLLGVEVCLVDRKKTKQRWSGAGDQSAQPYSAVCFASSSWYEIEAGGKKFVGSAQLRKEKGFLQHGSILLSFSPETLLTLLGQNVNERLIKGLQSRVTSLSEVMRGYPERETILSALTSGLGRSLGVEWTPGELTAEELKLAEKLKAEKYLNPEWNIHRNMRRLDGDAR